MCGIVGYIGKNDALPILIGGLKKLEYRGYDSSGVALIDGGKIETVRASGKISALEAKIKDHPIQGHIGIAHTRTRALTATSQLSTTALSRTTPS